MPSWENLNDFLQPETAGGFAVPAVLSFQGSTVQRQISGIFDDPYFDTQLGEYIADTSSPRFTCRMEDVFDALRGDYLTIDGKTYSIMSAPHGDGTGLAVLRLEISEETATRSTTIALLSPAVLSETTTGTAIDVSVFHGLTDMVLNASATGGSGETATVKLIHCDTIGGIFVDVVGGAFVIVTSAAASCQALELDANALKRFVKVVVTLSGTTPVVTMGVTISAKLKN